MSLLLLFVVAAQAQSPELQSPTRSEPYDFEISLPKGWEMTRTSASVFFRVQAPKDGLADGASWLAHHNSNHPVSLAYLAEVFRKRAETDYPGYKSVTERNLSAGGFPAHQMVFHATARGTKDLLFVHTVIQRQLVEYFILDVVGASHEKDRLLDLSDRMLATFRSGFPGPREREDRVDRTLALLKAAPPQKSFAGTCWHELIVGDKKLGWQKTVLREAKVDGAPGWEFEIECRQEDVEGGTRLDVSKGAFTADGAIQRVDLKRTVRTPKDPPVDVTEKVDLTRGVLKATREFLGQKVDKEIKVPPGTFLSDVAESMRPHVAMAPPGKHALRVLEPFCDLPLIEEWENAAASKIRVDGKELELYHALVTHTRQQPMEYLYDLDGALRRRKGAGGFMILKRSTEAEARKP